MAGPCSGHELRLGPRIVELTGGTAVEQGAVGSTPNFEGLHGNAFLTRCHITDAVLFRDRVGPYFSDRKSFANAGGYEKRLGGRMGMFGRITVGKRRLVIGSTHKLTGHSTGIRAYIGTDAAITGGDQDRAFCGRIGLAPVDNASAPTWPATCTSAGRARGDNVCSNMRVAVSDTTVLPCVDRFGVRIQVSDHAIVKVGLHLV